MGCPVVFSGPESTQIVQVRMGYEAFRHGIDCLGGLLMANAKWSRP
jgi:hypothetical protein